MLNLVSKGRQDLSPDQPIRRANDQQAGAHSWHHIEWNMVEETVLDKWCSLHEEQTNNPKNGQRWPGVEGCSLLCPPLRGGKRQVDEASGKENCLGQHIQEYIVQENSKRNSPLIQLPL